MRLVMIFALAFLLTACSSSSDEPKKSSEPKPKDAPTKTVDGAIGKDQVIEILNEIGYENVQENPTPCPYPESLAKFCPQSVVNADPPGDVKVSVTVFVQRSPKEALEALPMFEKTGVPPHLRASNVQACNLVIRIIATQNTPPVVGNDASQALQNACKTV